MEPRHAGLHSILQVGMGVNQIRESLATATHLRHGGELLLLDLQVVRSDKRVGGGGGGGARGRRPPRRPTRHGGGGAPGEHRAPVAVGVGRAGQRGYSSAWAPQRTTTENRLISTIQQTQNMKPGMARTTYQTEPDHASASDNEWDSHCVMPTRRYDTQSLHGCTRVHRER